MTAAEYVVDVAVGAAAAAHRGKESEELTTQLLVVQFANTSSEREEQL